MCRPNEIHCGNFRKHSPDFTLSAQTEFRERNIGDKTSNNRFKIVTCIGWDFMTHRITFWMILGKNYATTQ